jgi:hypothetical protein
MKVSSTCRRASSRARSSSELPGTRRHLRRHHRHEQHVGVERQAGHVDDGAADVASASMRGSAIREPSGCRTPAAMRSVSGVAALPMSIWPQAMSNFRPSSASTW